MSRIFGICRVIWIVLFKMSALRGGGRRSSVGLHNKGAFKVVIFQCYCLHLTLIFFTSIIKIRPLDKQRSDDHADVTWHGFLFISQIRWRGGGGEWKYRCWLFRRSISFWRFQSKKRCNFGMMSIHLCAVCGSKNVIFYI